MDSGDFVQDLFELLPKNSQALADIAMPAWLNDKIILN